MDILPKLINSLGLILDIIGAGIVYFYVFNRPKKMTEQQSLPVTSTTEVIDGVEVNSVTMGVRFDLKASQINDYNDYKNELIIMRARFGFYCLVLGFFLQIIGNVGEVLDQYAVYTIVSIVMVFLLLGYMYLFVYLFNLHEIPAGAGENFSVKQEKTEGGVGFTVNSDPEFQEWSRKVLKFRARMGLTRQATQRGWRRFFYRAVP